MKKNLKKLTALFLSLAMVLALAACGGGEETTDEGGSTTDEGGAAATGESMEIKIGTVNYDGSVQVRALEVFKDTIEEASGGRITVEIYAGSVLGNNEVMLDMLYNGDIQIDVVNPVAFETQVPEMSLLNNYYTFDSLDHVHNFFEGEGGDFIFDAYNSIGLQGMAIFSLGFRELYNSARPVETFEDLKGMSIRGYSTIQIAAWQAVGVDPVSVDWNELFVSLQQGLIDGEEGAICNYQDYSFFEVAPYFTMTDHVFSTDMALCSQEWIEGLSDEDRALVEEAMQAAYEYHRDNYQVENEELLQKFVDENGTQLNYASDELKQQMKEAMQPVTEKMIIELVGQETYDQYMSLVDAARVDTGDTAADTAAE